MTGKREMMGEGGRGHGRREWKLEEWRGGGRRKMDRRGERGRKGEGRERGREGEGERERWEQSQKHIWAEPETSPNSEGGHIVDESGIDSVSILNRTNESRPNELIEVHCAGSQEKLRTEVNGCVRQHDEFRLRQTQLCLHNFKMKSASDESNHAHIIRWIRHPKITHLIRHQLEQLFVLANAPKEIWTRTTSQLDYELCFVSKKARSLICAKFSSQYKYSVTALFHGCFIRSPSHQTDSHLHLAKVGHSAWDLPRIADELLRSDGARAVCATRG